MEVNLDFRDKSAAGGRNLSLSLSLAFVFPLSLSLLILPSLSLAAYISASLRAVADVILLRASFMARFAR